MPVETKSKATAKKNVNTPAPVATAKPKIAGGAKKEVIVKTSPGRANNPEDRKDVERLHAGKAPEAPAAAAAVTVAPKAKAPAGEKPVAKKTLSLKDLNFKQLPVGKETDHGYGVKSAPVYYVDSKGEAHPTDQKEVTKGDRFVRIVSDKYTPIPNEEILELVKEAGVTPFKVDYGRDGNAMYVQVLSDKIEEAIQPGDVVKLGTVITNSIDASESLSCRTFTYRLVCKNGAVGQGELLGAAIQRHVGDRKRLVDQFRLNIDAAIAASKRLTDMYKRSLKVRMDQKIAQAIVDTGIGLMYLPDWIEVETKDGKRKAKLLEAGQGLSLWEGFNAMTDTIWHNEERGMAGRIKLTQFMHNVMIQHTAGVVA